jgi:hypothetical protein
MADASGTPTSPDNIPTYNTGVDPPSGKGFNTAMAQIQSIITNLKAGTLASGKIAMAALNATGTPSASTLLQGDGSWAGAYNAYTPTLNSSGGGGSIGNGTITGRYSQVGKRIHYAGRLILGTTTSFGRGSLWVSLPVSFANNSVLLVGHGYAFDQDTSTITSVHAIAVGPSVVRFTGTSTFNGVGNDVSGTVPFPFAWAVNDELNWNIVYEAA